MRAPSAEPGLPGGWSVGDLIDVEGKAGWELGATILGRPEGKDEDELRVRFMDGEVDDWPYEVSFGQK